MYTAFLKGENYEYSNRITGGSTCMSAKGVIRGVLAAGLALAGGLKIMEEGYGGCIFEGLHDGRGVVAACAGKTAAEATLGPVEKLDEAATSTVPITVIGEVVMRLNGSAVVDVNNQGFSKFWEGNILGKTDSTLFWNRGNDKPVTVIYNPCFGMTVNGPSPEKSLAVPKNGYNSAPVSTVVADVIPKSPTEVSIKIKTGPMQVCFLRVPNALDEPGGPENLQLFTTDDGTILKTNSNTGAKDAIQAAVATDINEIVKESAAMQACPEQALNNAGLSDEAIKEIVAQATIGGLLKQYANKQANGESSMTTMISNAYTDFITKARPDSITVELGSPDDRIAMYKKKLEATVNKLTDKKIELPGQNVEYTWKEIGIPTQQGCGTGSLQAPN